MTTLDARISVPIVCDRYLADDFSAKRPSQKFPVLEIEGRSIQEHLTASQFPSGEVLHPRSNSNSGFETPPRESEGKDNDD